MAHLTLAGGEQAGRRIDLLAVMCVGRGLDMDVRLDDLAVSEKHARFLCGNDGRYMLEDLESAGGTFLNGLPVTSEWLNDGDEVRVGEVAFVFHEDPARRDDREPAAVETAEEGAAEPGLLREVLYAGVTAPESVARAQALLKAAEEIGESIFDGLGEDEILARLLRWVFEVFPETDRALVMLRPEGAGGLHLRAEKVAEGVEAGQVPDVSGTLLEYVLEHRKALLSCDAADDDSVGGAEQDGSPQRSVMCAPLLRGDDVLGFVLAETRQLAGTYVAEGLTALAELSRSAGAAIGHVRLGQ